jgi:hypothetical protein
MANKGFVNQHQSRGEFHIREGVHCGLHGISELLIFFRKARVQAVNIVDGATKLWSWADIEYSM